MIVVLWLLFKLLFPQGQNESKIEIKRHLKGLVSSSHDVPVPCCGVMVSPTRLHSFLFCTSGLNIPCAETKLYKKHWLYKLFKPGAFARVLDFFCIEGQCPYQQAAWPVRSKLVGPGAWYWWPDVHTLKMLSSSSLDLWAGHPAVVWGWCSCSLSAVLCPGNVSRCFLPSKEKPSCSKGTPWCKVFCVMGRHGQDTCFKVYFWARIERRDMPRKSQFSVVVSLGQRDLY